LFKVLDQHTTVTDAYHAKALEVHPDKHPDEAEKYTAKFKIVQAAHSLLKKEIELCGIVDQPTTSNTTTEPSRQRKETTNYKPGKPSPATREWKTSHHNEWARDNKRQRTNEKERNVDPFDPEQQRSKDKRGQKVWDQILRQREAKIASKLGRAQQERNAVNELLVEEAHKRSKGKQTALMATVEGKGIVEVFNRNGERSLAIAGARTTRLKPEMGQTEVSIEDLAETKMWENIEKDLEVKRRVEERDLAFVVPGEFAHGGKERTEEALGWWEEWRFQAEDEPAIFRDGFKEVFPEFKMMMDSGKSLAEVWEQLVRMLEEKTEESKPEEKKAKEVATFWIERQRNTKTETKPAVNTVEKKERPMPEMTKEMKERVHESVVRMEYEEEIGMIEQREEGRKRYTAGKKDEEWLMIEDEEVSALQGGEKLIACR